MLLSMVPDDDLYPLLSANRRLHRVATAILLERRHFRACGGSILVLHENIAFTALGVYSRRVQSLSMMCLAHIDSIPEGQLTSSPQH